MDCIKEGGLCACQGDTLRKCNGVTDTVTIKRSDLEKFTKRSLYPWSEGGEYTAQDWKNEGAIACALKILETALEKK